MTAAVPRRVLFVCTGNICRSLMAERILRRLSLERGLDWEARSCGIAADSYFQPPAEIDAALSPLGLSSEGHRAQLVGRELLGWCDVALAMTQDQCEAILDRFPEFTRKVFRLRDYVGLPPEDIADPMGAAQKVYDACRDSLVIAVNALLAKP